MRRAAALVLLLSSCKRPSEQECRAMLDRYVDMTIDADPELQRAPELSRAPLREIKREEKRASDVYKEKVARCTREVSRRELECAMKAPSANEWEACL